MAWTMTATVRGAAAAWGQCRGAVQGGATLRAAPAGGCTTRAPHLAVGPCFGACHVRRGRERCASGDTLHHVTLSRAQPPFCVTRIRHYACHSPTPGFVDDAEGWDFGGRCSGATAASCGRCVPGPDTSDASGAGTLVASLAVGSWDNETASAGVAPGAKLLPLRIADCRGGGRLWASGAVQAFEYAAGAGAAVVITPWADGGALGGGGGHAAVFAPLPHGLLSAAAAAVPARHGKGEGRGRSAAANASASSSAKATAAAAAGAAAEAEAGARRQLFEDAVAPLARAGALVVAADVAPPRGAPAGPTTGAPPGVAPREAGLPCALGRDHPNVVCVAPAGGGGAGADFRVPGSSLLGAYPGGSYAAASGSAAAAGLGGGAAALVWSALGARLGGDYSALGPMVKRLLLDASTAPPPPPTPPADANRAGHIGGAGLSSLHAAGKGGAAASGPSPLPQATPAAGSKYGAPLRLAEAVAAAAARRLPFDVAIAPPPPPQQQQQQQQQLDGVGTGADGVAVPGATLSWYVNQYGATNAAVLQGVLSRPLADMAMSDWEYTSKGDTVLTAVLSARLPIAQRGSYALRVESSDAFALWLGGRRLLLVEDPLAPPEAGEDEKDEDDGEPVAVGGNGGTRRWVARASFDAPGKQGGTAGLGGCRRKGGGGCRRPGM
jgi:hypothetical protein